MWYWMWYTNHMTKQTFICSTCDKPKPATQFWTRNQGKYRRKQCKKCMYITCNKRYDYAKERARKLKKKYNLSQEQYNTLLKEQNGICAICPNKQATTGRNRGVLIVDHNHLTGINRGLLCSRCNRTLGLFGDSIPLLISAINYLSKYEKSVQQTQTSQQSI